jgi:hypothetical protein
MKKSIMFSVLFLFSFSLTATAVDGFFIDTKGGFLLKVDVASAFAGKRLIGKSESIYTGIGQYGATVPHGYPRVLESNVAPYGDLIFDWGYKFPKIFSLGFGLMLSNFVMPSLMFNYKFSFLEDKMVRPYTFVGFYGGLFDGFPIGLTAGGGIDIYLTKMFYFLVETKLGTEIFVSRYYDDGINSNPIWHWDSVYAYGLFSIYIGFGFQFKNPFTDENGKFIGKK